MIYLFIMFMIFSYLFLYVLTYIISKCLRLRDAGSNGWTVLDRRRCLFVSLFGPITLIVMSIMYLPNKCRRAIDKFIENGNNPARW